MKKLISLLLALVLIIAMAVPAFAMTSTTQEKERTKNYTVGNNTYTCVYSATANTSKATATITLPRTGVNISANIGVTISKANSTPYSREVGDIGNLKVSVSITAPGTTVDGKITYARATYTAFNDYVDAFTFY